MARPYGAALTLINISGPTDMVTISIPSGQTFTVPSKQLTYHSDYFKKALEGGWAEARTLEFSLVEHADAVYASILFDWIQRHGHGEFFFFPRDHFLENRLVEDVAKRGPDDEPLALYKALCEVWLLADYLQMRELHDELMCSLCFPPAEFAAELEIELDMLITELSSSAVSQHPKLWARVCYTIVEALLKHWVRNEEVKLETYKHVPELVARLDQDTTQYVLYCVACLAGHRGTPEEKSLDILKNCLYDQQCAGVEYRINRSKLIGAHGYSNDPVPISDFVFGDL